jgi:hypothetical protein
MKRIIKLFYHLLFAWIFIVLIGFTKQIPSTKGIDDNIAENQDVSINSIPVDIYIDATTSMEGFAINENSVYSKFLDQLEASIITAWKKSDSKYYKFGGTIREIQRSEYLQAKSNKTFYREKGVFEKTLIDNVLQKTNNSRLSIVITDLFQNEGDVNVMVDKIKSRCLMNNVMFCLLGIKSDFDGRVFVEDNNNTNYLLKDKRPFYALVFGDAAYIERLIEILKVKEPISQANIFLIANQMVDLDNVIILKAKTSTFINRIAPRSNLKNSFDFSMKKKGNEASFTFELTYTKKMYCLDYNKALEVVAYKKSFLKPTDKISYRDKTTDITFDSFKFDGNKITASIKLINSDPEGNYSYVIYLQPNQINGFILPKWINDFSTENPIASTPSASKTYNLQKLIDRVVVAKNTVTSTYISKCYINIYKQ